jgi:hypothetical protein
MSLLLPNQDNTSPLKKSLSHIVYLTQKHPYGYDNKTTVKNSGQNWTSGLLKIHSRILHGFFYACKIRYVMTSCIKEPSGSPYSFLSGNANFVQPVAFQFALKPTVSHLLKETV